MAQAQAESFKFDLGQMSTNLQAAFGIQQAIHTVSYATKTLEQECRLQEEEAKVMGGAGSKDASKGGLMGMEFTAQVTSAEKTKNSGYDEANGLIVAGCTGLLSLGAMGLFAKFGSGDKSAQETCKNLETFNNRLTTSPSSPSEATIGEETPEEIALERAADARIMKWTGTDATLAQGTTPATNAVAPDFSDITSNDKAQQLPSKDAQELNEEAKATKEVNDRAVMKLRQPGNVEKMRKIQQNLDKEIAKMKLNIADRQNQKVNSGFQVMGVGSGAATSFAQSGGKIGSAGEQYKSGVQQALNSIYGKADNMLSQQFGNAQSAVGADQALITSTLQNIAFPA